MYDYESEIALWDVSRRVIVVSGMVTFIMGRRGEDGEDGRAGPPARRGARGPAGARGAARQAPAGRDGEDGRAGFPGLRGRQGATGAAGGGGSVGTATLDFGAFPGKADASVDVVGQAGIVAGSVVDAWIRLVATADHSADEHLVEGITIIAGNIVPATGFTIYGVERSPVAEGQAGRLAGGDGHRLYGQWTVAWSWS